MISIISSERHSKGLTIVELQIALVLLIVISTLLFSGLRLTQKSWATSEKSIEATDDLRTTSQLIYRQLTELQPILWIEEDERKILFQGEEDSIEFVGKLPAHRGPGGYYQQKLFLDRTQENLELKFAYHLLHPDSDNGSLSEEQEETKLSLIKDISSFQVSYFGAQEKDEEQDWHTNWESEIALPNLVKINVATKNHTWPDLLIPIYSVFRNQRVQQVVRQ